MAKKEVTATMHAKNLGLETARRRVTKVLVKTGTYLFLGAMALIVLFPFYWMIISSLKTLDEYRLSVPTFWPKPSCSATMPMPSPLQTWAVCS